MGIYQTTVDHYQALYPALGDRHAFLFEYAQCLAKTGQYEESNRMLERAIRISCDPMLYNVMGKNYQALHQYKEAENCFYRAHYTVPNRLYPLYLLAKLYAESEQVEKAVAMARRVVEMVPKVPSPATDEMKQEIKAWLDERTLTVRDEPYTSSISKMRLK
jgi:tetratricopeptide (TPR) repeat protein